MFFQFSSLLTYNLPVQTSPCPHLPFGFAAGQWTIRNLFALGFPHNPEHGFEIFGRNAVAVEDETPTDWAGTVAMASSFRLIPSHQITEGAKRVIRSFKPPDAVLEFKFPLNEKQPAAFYSSPSV